MTIYYYGCRCGPVGKQIQAVRKLHPEVDIKNSKYDKEAMTEHVKHLIAKNLMSDYPAIVVDKGNVVPLSQWS